MREVDVVISNNVIAFMATTAMLIVKLLTISYFTPVYLLPEAALAGTTYGLGRYYMASQMSVKRQVPSVHMLLVMLAGGLTNLSSQGDE